MTIVTVAPQITIYAMATMAQYDISINEIK